MGIRWAALSLLCVLPFCANVSAYQIQNTFRRMSHARLASSATTLPARPVSAPASAVPAALTSHQDLDLSVEPVREFEANPQSPYSLEYFESRSLKDHPRLRQLAWEVQALHSEALQQSLRPNPRVGVFVDEMFNEGEAGMYGAMVTDTHVPEVQLQRRAHAKSTEADTIRAQMEVVRQQIRTDVRTAFFRVLIAQRQNELASRLVNSYQLALDRMQGLLVAGEIPQSDILQVEIQQQMAATSLSDAQAALASAWRSLVALTGDTSLAMENVQGDLDQLAEPLDFNEVLADLCQRSPEVNVATAQIRQAQAVLQREQANAMQSTQTQWSVGRDSASDHVFAGLQVSMPLQTYNRNQGNIAAAQSRLQAAHLESEVLARRLTNRLAAEFQTFQSARRRSTIYVDEVLPKAREALSMVNRAFEAGEAGFLELLTSQRTLINSTNQYLQSLEALWISRQQIEGLLLSNSLDRSDSR